MEAYRLYTVVPRLVDFINLLTNGYVRLNRGRCKCVGGNTEEAFVSLSVLYECLLTLCRLMSPFTPFFTEYLYQNLRRIHPVPLFARPSFPRISTTPTSRSTPWVVRSPFTTSCSRRPTCSPAATTP